MEPSANRGASTHEHGSFSLLPDGSVARHVGLALAAVTVAVMVAFAIVFTLHRLAPIGNGDWRRIVDIGGESNIPTWWNATLLAAVAVAAVAASEISRVTDPRARTAWWIVAAAATYLSIDEHAVIHERLSRPVNALDIELPTYAWLLPGTVLAALGATVLVVAGRRLPRLTAGRLGVALGLYGLGALGLEGVNGWIRDHIGDTWVYTVGLIAEEGTEMGACVYAVTAIVDAFRYRRTDTGVAIAAR